MSATPLDSVAVVTVAYNSSAALAPFLESIESSETEHVRVVIADNDSNDRDATRLLAESHGAELLELPDNRGYGGAINAAVATLPPVVEYVLISNPDVLVHDHAISILLERLADDPEVAAVGPRVLNEDGTTYPSARRLPSLRTGIGHALFAGLWPSNPWTRSYRSERQATDTERSVGWLSGSCLMVRRSVFEKIGGFDEGYFMYFEDVDLGYRLSKEGLTRLFIPSAVVVHSGAHSTTSESAKMLQVHHDSAYRYLEKKYAGPVLAPVRWTLRAGLAVRSWYLIRQSTRRR